VDGSPRGDQPDDARAEGPGSLRWSPDGKWIGFVMFTSQVRRLGDRHAAPPPNAKWTAPPRVVNRLALPDGPLRVHPNRVQSHLSGAGDGGTARQAHHGEWSVGAPFDALTLWRRLGLAS
jgi:hypothetical protein